MRYPEPLARGPGGGARAQRVTFFRPRELADLLRLPEGVVTLGWLCVGWPDERPPERGLERAGWSKKQPLEDVVFHDRWPVEEESPASPPSHVLRAPDQASEWSRRATTRTPSSRRPAP